MAELAQMSFFDEIDNQQKRIKLREANTSRSFFHARRKEDRNAKKTKEALCHPWLPKPDGWTLL